MTAVRHASILGESLTRQKQAGAELHPASVTRGHAGKNELFWRGGGDGSKGDAERLRVVTKGAGCDGRCLEPVGEMTAMSLSHLGHAAG